MGGAQVTAGERRAPLAPSSPRLWSWVRGPGCGIPSPDHQGHLSLVSCERFRA